jgi:hypothetical protein
MADASLFLLILPDTNQQMFTANQYRADWDLSIRVICPPFSQRVVDR